MCGLYITTYSPWRPVPPTLKKFMEESASKSNPIIEKEKEDLDDENDRKTL